MKRIKILVLVLIALIAVAICLHLLPKQEHEATNGYYTYEVYNGEATITKCDTTIEGDVTIPSTLEGYPVVSIGSYAFKKCINMTSVSIPDSVTNIGYGAFTYCEGLTDITIPDSVTTIDRFAFAWCSGLTRITIPDSVTALGSHVFANCKSLTTATIGKGEPAIDEGVFFGCAALEKVIVHSVNNSFHSECVLKPKHTIYGVPGSTAEAFAEKIGAKFDVLVAPIELISQTVNAVVEPGETASVTLNVAGGGLTYKWYYKNADATDFALTESYTGNTYSVEMDESRIGRQVYCVVTDGYGESVSSDVVTLDMINELRITSQPTSVTVDNGHMATVKFTAKGIGLTYHWYFKNEGASEFTLAESFNDSIYSVPMDPSRAGRQIYCVVTDQDGNTAQTDTVTLNMSGPIKITAQPTSITVGEGQTATVKFIAVGKGLTYQWYFKNEDMSEFALAESFADSIYSVPMDPSRAGRQIYCVVTDQDGNTVQTDTVTLNMSGPIKITAQPTSITVGEGQTATVKFIAVGKGLTYQWYFKNEDMSEFALAESFADSIYSVTMNASRAGRQIYCVVTDQDGNTVQTDTVTLEMK